MKAHLWPPTSATQGGRAGKADGPFPSGALSWAALDCYLRIELNHKMTVHACKWLKPAIWLETGPRGPRFNSYFGVHPDEMHFHTFRKTNDSFRIASLGPVLSSLFPSRPTVSISKIADNSPWFGSPSRARSSRAKHRTSGLQHLCQSPATNGRPYNEPRGLCSETATLKRLPSTRMHAEKNNCLDWPRIFTRQVSVVKDDTAAH